MKNDKENGSSLAKSEVFRSRRSQLHVAKFLAFLLMAGLLVFLLSAHIVEARIVRYLLDSAYTPIQFLAAITGVFIFLGIYTVAHSRLVLHLSYRIENLRMARTVVLSFFLVVYLVAISSLQEVPLLVPMAAAKIFSVLLFFRFWESQIALLRVRHKELTHPRAFIVSFEAFLVCRWIVVACWFLTFFGFALSLISADPVIEMSGLESVFLLGTFFFLFRIFVRNPVAHPFLSESKKGEGFAFQQPDQR